MASQNFFQRLRSRFSMVSPGGKKATIVEEKREIPAGHELRQPFDFAKRRRQSLKNLSAIMRGLKIGGATAAAAKRLFRIRYVASMLGQDTHIGACTKDTVLFLSKFVLGEIKAAREHPNSAVARIYRPYSEVLSHVEQQANSLLQRAAAQNPPTDKRFMAPRAKRHFSVNELEGLIYDAEVSLRGKAAAKSPILNVNPLFFHSVETISTARLIETLGEEKYDAIIKAEQALVAKNSGQPRQS